MECDLSGNLFLDRLAVLERGTELPTAPPFNRLFIEAVSQSLPHLNVTGRSVDRNRQRYDDCAVDFLFASLIGVFGVQDENRARRRYAAIGQVATIVRALVHHTRRVVKGNKLAGRRGNGTR